MIPTDEFERVNEFVRQHKVSWKVWPIYHVKPKGEKVQIGFELELSGTHHEPKEPPEPGCVECVTVYKDLKRSPNGSFLKRSDKAVMKSGSLIRRFTLPPRENS